MSPLVILGYLKKFLLRLEPPLHGKMASRWGDAKSANLSTRYQTNELLLESWPGLEFSIQVVYRVAQKVSHCQVSSWNRI